MTTLAVDNPLTVVTGDFNAIGIVATDIVYEGAMVGENASGYGRPLVAGDLFVGHSLEQVDNSTGAAGDKNIRLRTGRYRGSVTLTGVLITDVSKEVYASDDDTLTLSAAGNSRVGVVIRYIATNKAVVEFQTNEPFEESMDGEITYGDIEVGGSYQGLYSLDTTKNYPIGTKRTTPDGRTFYYSKSGGACYTGQGSAFYSAEAIAANCAAAVEAGVSTITFANQTFAADELKGGFITVFGNPDGAPNNASCPHRRIIGNTVCDGETVTITVDYAFDRAIDNAQFCEVYYNPYADLRLGTSGLQTFGGFANVYVEEADQYFWLQTWGPLWGAPQTASFGTGECREVYFRADGSIEARGAHDGTNRQRAGILIPSGYGAGPLILLQISP